MQWKEFEAIWPVILLIIGVIFIGPRIPKALTWNDWVQMIGVIMIALAALKIGLGLRK